MGFLWALNRRPFGPPMVFAMGSPSASLWALGEIHHTQHQKASKITKCMTLEKGDVIATGTPQGVGPVVDGQTIRAGIKGVIEMKFDVKDRGY